VINKSVAEILSAEIRVVSVFEKRKDPVANFVERCRSSLASNVDNENVCGIGDSLVNFVGRQGSYGRVHELNNVETSQSSCPTKGKRSLTIEAFGNGQRCASDGPSKLGLGQEFKFGEYDGDKFLWGVVAVSVSVGDSDDGSVMIVNYLKVGSFNESLNLPRVEMPTQERFYIRYGINAVQWVLGNARFSIVVKSYT
jgi:hypothetical protein